MWPSSASVTGAPSRKATHPAWLGPRLHPRPALRTRYWYQDSRDSHSGPHDMSLVQTCDQSAHDQCPEGQTTALPGPQAPPSTAQP